MIFPDRRLGLGGEDLASKAQILSYYEVFSLTIYFTSMIWYMVYVHMIMLKDVLSSLESTGRVNWFPMTEWLWDENCLQSLVQVNIEE